MEKNVIKNIVFDIGSVLVKYSPNSYAEKINISIENLDKAHEILINTKEWRDYLNGNIENEKILSKLVQKNSQYIEEFKLMLLKENNVNITCEIIDNTQLLKKLSNNYNIYLLSNIAKDTMDSFKEIYDFEKFAKGAVYSYEVHIGKPHREIYDLLFSKYSLKPNECIFIDDKLRNIEKATELGMVGILYTNYENLLKELGGILG